MENSKFSWLLARNGGYDEKPETGSCAKHGGYSFRAFFDKQTGERVGAIGAACATCYEERKAADDEAEAMRYFREDQAAAGVPLRYADAKLSAIEQSANGNKVILEFLAYAKQFQNTPPTSGLILLGPPGTGKTHLSCALVSSVVFRRKSARYVTAQGMIRAIRATWERGAEKSEGAVIEQHASPSLLVIDEVGVQVGSENERGLIFEVINRRYNALKPTILAGNCTLAELPKFIDERALDRMREGEGKALLFNWPSLRKTA